MTNFQATIRAAQIYLFLGRHDKALASLRLALPEANRLSPSHRRVTLRAMNWTRAAAKGIG